MLHILICMQEGTMYSIFLVLSLKAQEEERLELKHLLPEAGSLGDESQKPFLS